MLLGKTGEGRVDILVGATIQNNKPLSEAVRRLLHIPRLPLSLRAVLIHKQADQLGLGYELPQQSEPLCSQQGGKKGGSRYIRAGPIETRDEPYVDWVFSYPEDDRNGVGCRSRRTTRMECRKVCQHRHEADTDFGCERW